MIMILIMILMMMIIKFLGNGNVARLDFKLYLDDYEYNDSHLQNIDVFHDDEDDDDIMMMMFIVMLMLMLMLMLRMMMFIVMSRDRGKELTDDGRRTTPIQLFPPSFR